MNTLFKRITAACAAAVMTIGLAGCGESKTSSPSGDTSAPAGDASAPSGDASVPAGNGGKIVIGGIGPLTGDNAQYGNAVKNGMELAAEEINAAGGVNGITLEIAFEDDVTEAEKAMNAYNALKDKDMKILCGTVTSGSCTAVAPLAVADGMFLLTPSGSAVNCITAGDNCFRMCFADPDQGTLSADYIADNLKKTKVGAIYQSDSDYSSGIFQAFKTEAANKGLEIVAEAAFTKDSATDFSAQVKQVADSGAEIMFLPFYYTEASLVLQEAKKQGLEITVFGCDGLDGLIGTLGDKIDVANGVYVLSPYASTSPEEKSQKFTKAYQAKFPNVEVNQFAADGYDSVYAVKQAMEKASVNDASISAKDLGDKLKAAMLEIEFDGVTGKTKWAASGEPSKAPKVLQITVADGKGSYTLL